MNQPQGDHDEVEQKIRDHQDDGDSDSFFEAFQENGGKKRNQGESKTDVHCRVIEALQRVVDERILDDMRGGVSRLQRDRDNEVSGDESQQNQDEELALPP